MIEINKDTNTDPIPVDVASFFSCEERQDFCVPLPFVPSAKVVLVEEDDKRMRFLHRRIRRIVAAIKTMIRTRMTETATMMKYSNRN